MYTSERKKGVGVKTSGTPWLRNRESQKSTCTCTYGNVRLPDQSQATNLIQLCKGSRLLILNICNVEHGVFEAAWLSVDVTGGSLNHVDHSIIPSDSLTAARALEASPDLRMQQHHAPLSFAGVICISLLYALISTGTQDVEACHSAPKKSRHCLNYVHRLSCYSQE